jgi:hypothetical protein
LALAVENSRKTELDDATKDVHEYRPSLVAATNHTGATRRNIPEDAIVQEVNLST